MENFILLKMFIQNTLLEKSLINLLISVVIFKYLSCFYDENLKWETFQEQTLCCTIIVFLSALLMSVPQ